MIARRMIYEKASKYLNGAFMLMA